MRKSRKRLWSFLMILSLLCSLGAGIPPLKGIKAVSEAAENNFVDLNQQEILQAMGAGWNLGNQLEASDGSGTPKEDAWTGVKITERMVRTAKTNGFRSIRIPVSYLSMIGAGPDYTINKTWLDRVQQVVDWAVKYDLYVIMNIHGDGYSSVTGGWLLPDAEDQDTIQKKFAAVWKQIAERFQDYDQHIIFESMNEIGANIVQKQDVTKAEIKDAYENVNDYNQIFVDTVRQSGGNNDKRWLLIPGMNTDIDYTAGNYGFQIPQDTYRSAEIPQEEKRLMISVHYYTPWDFCGQEDYVTTQWGEDADVDKKVGYGQESDMETAFTRLKKTFTSKGYPVVIGEYGSIDKSKQEDSGKGKAGSPDVKNTRFRADYAAAVCSNSLENGCIPVYWDNGWNGDFGFGLFDRTTYKVTQPEILAAIMSYYNRDEGTATAVTLDKKSLTMSLVGGKQQLSATLTPANAKDSVQWQSSDKSVATVNYNGNVSPKGVGTCLITATVAGGATAACVVKVKASSSFQAGLYAQNAADWNTLEGDNFLELAEDGGGTFTLSFSGTKEQMSKLNTIFLKDVAVHKGLADDCILQSAQFVVDSLDFNGNACTMSTNTFDYEEEDAKNDQGELTGKKSVLDLCMLNYWHEPDNCINELKKNAGSNAGCSFPSDFYVNGTNVLTMKVTVKNAVLKKDFTLPEDVDATALSLSQENVTVKPEGKAQLTAAVTPQNSTEKVLWYSENTKIATVEQDGVITGVKNGETVVHALTLSGQDVSCTVTVDENAEVPQATTSAEPTKSAEPQSSNQPSTEPSTEPSAEPTTTPSTEPSTTPSTAPSTAPSTLPSVTPSTKPSTMPSVSPTKNPGDNQGTQTMKTPVPGSTAKPQTGSTGEKTGLAKGAIFTVGKLKYKVTAVGQKNTVAVQAPKSKNAKALTIPASVKKDSVTYSVTSLGASAFKNCKKLSKITIGKNVTSIGKNAFAGAKKLKRITVKSSKLKKIGKNAFRSIHKKAVIKVPKKKLKAYQKLWKKKGQKQSVAMK